MSGRGRRPDEQVGRAGREGGRREASLKSYRDIFEEEIQQAEAELERGAVGLLASSLIAGLGVSVGAFLAAVIVTMAGGVWSEPVVRLIAANAYAVGFILVILGRTDLFTEYTTITLFPVLAGKASVRALARVWALILVANLVGAAAFALFMTVLGPALGVIEPRVFGDLAADLLAHPGWVIMLSATLAGWLMGMLSWLIAAGRDTVSQVLFVWIIGATIGLGHLHHVVTGTTEVLAAIFAGQGVGYADYGRFLLWCVVGNVIGGVLFASLMRYSVIQAGR
jgi:formate-nitrite transporter family protein